MLDECGRRRVLEGGYGFTDGENRKLAERENGFAVVVAGAFRAVMVADRIRTYPLFYAARGKRLLISDDASWIRSRLADSAIDPGARSEFRQAGFVVGPKTLYRGIATVQAGEIVSGQWGDDGWRFSRHRYFRYFQTDAAEASCEALQEDLDRVLETVFTNLIARFDGRKLVVPLSGGFDSRLILSWLKRLNYGDIGCYTFGTPTTRDCIKAMQVAKQLDVDIHFVHLTRTLWRRTYQSRARREFIRHFAGYSSVLSSQEFPAFCQLVRERRLPQNAVILPGHTGDFISGGHIPRDIRNRARTKAAAVEYIFRKHFTLWETIDLPHRRRIKRRIIDTIEKQIGGFSITSAADVGAAIEYYDWQERQAKFIIQFNAVYKYFGFAFALPLWADDLIRFFLNVPLELKLGSRLYRDYLRNYDRFGIFQDATAPVDVDVRKRGVIHQRLKRLKRAIYHDTLYKQFILYFRDELNFYTPFNYFRLVGSLGMFRNPNAFFVQDFLRALSRGRL